MWPERLAHQEILHIVETLTITPRILGNSLPRKVLANLPTQKIATQGQFSESSDNLYTYSYLYLQTPLAEAIILYPKRHIRNVDVVVLQLMKRYFLLCEHFVYPKTLGPHFYGIVAQIVPMYVIFSPDALGPIEPAKSIHLSMRPLMT